MNEEEDVFADNRLIPLVVEVYSSISISISNAHESKKVFIYFSSHAFHDLFLFPPQYYYFDQYQTEYNT
eukprot:m.265483 g.265483  ORF g.265483 m.265483 type:complete len:69 (+) comp62000_c0_seq1:115-321(+)